MTTKYFSVYILITLFLTHCGFTQSSTNLQLDQFIKTYKTKKNAQLIDVRTPEEWSKGKLSTSICINFKSDKFMDEASKLDKSKPIFLFCAAGVRSGNAAQKLKAAGFKEVYSLTGDGYEGLKKSGL